MDKITIDNYEIELSSTDKVLFPENYITKGDLINYYNEISEVMLPHVQGRPLTMNCFPNGIAEEGFMRKEAPDYFPIWVEREIVDKKQDGEQVQVITENKATLVYLANQNCITFHVWLSRMGHLEQPDKMVFDLDPPKDEFRLAISAAAYLKSVLEDELSLKSFVMSSGSKGLHVVVPLKPDKDFDTIRTFSQDVAAVVVDRERELFTTEPRKADRENRVYIDTLRNSYGQTSVAPYSVRAIKGAPVAVPLDWSELDPDTLHPQMYNIHNIFSRIEEKGDVWKSVWDNSCLLDEARVRLDALYSEIAVGGDFSGMTG